MHCKKRFKKYTKDIAEALNKEYKGLVENIFANDVAWDLSCDIQADKVWSERSGGIIRYYRGSTDRAREIFKHVYDMMKVGKKH